MDKNQLKGIKIIVFGATGKTGKLVCRRVLAAGATVTGFGRSREKIKSIDANLLVSQGDVYDAESVTKAIANHTVVMVCLGSINLKDRTTLSEGTKNIVAGMAQHQVKRLIVISAAGVEKSWSQISLLARVMFRTLLRNLFADHGTQETIVKQSALDWTIVRAAILNDKPASGVYRATNTDAVRTISRADLADFLGTQVLDTSHIRQAISVTS